MLRPGVIATLPWGRGSGKTVFGRICIHEWCLETPGLHVGLLMPTLKQARAVFWPHLLADYYGPLASFLRSKPNRTELSCDYANGSRLSTWGAENAQAIRGQRFDRIVQDEADDISPDVESAIVEPTFSSSGTRAIWVKTGTPRRGRNGELYRGYRRGQEGTPERRKIVEAGMDPEKHVSLLVRSDQSPRVDQVWLADVRKKLIASGRKTTYEREYCCNFDAAEGLVYAEFDRNFHVREPDAAIARWSEILVGIDHGFEDPAVLLVIGVLGSGRDAICWVLDEVYEQHLLDTDLERYARRIKEVYEPRCGAMRWFADPSRPDKIAMFRAAGIRVEEAKNAIEDGVMAVADRMAIRDVVTSPGETTRQARLYVAPRCANTIRELGMYRRKRDPNDGDRVLDAIEDRNNHAMDALRYGVFTRFGKPPAVRLTYDPYGGGDE